MIEWLNQNKEWFFSGIGIFLIGSIISFASIILTLIFKSRQERKKRKKLSVSYSTSSFEIPISDNTNISSEHVKVSYHGKEYENLYLYNIKLTQTAS